jgi:hypothetical protein
MRVVMFVLAAKALSVGISGCYSPEVGTGLPCTPALTCPEAQICRVWLL